MSRHNALLVSNLMRKVVAYWYFTARNAKYKLGKCSAEGDYRLALDSRSPERIVPEYVPPESKQTGAKSCVKNRIQ